jgi:hypothetical protein
MDESKLAEFDGAEPYEPPAIVEETEFETSALGACAGGRPKDTSGPPKQCSHPLLS